jgi:hypothetical protein
MDRCHGNESLNTGVLAVTNPLAAAVQKYRKLKYSRGRPLSSRQRTLLRWWLIWESSEATIPEQSRRKWYRTRRQDSGLLTYLLTELSPSWWAAICATTEELPSTLWNPKGQYGVHKSPPLDPILSHISPIHSITAYLSNIHFNIVHSYTSWCSQWSLSFWLSHGYPTCIPLLPHSCYMPRPSHPFGLCVIDLYRE